MSTIFFTTLKPLIGDDEWRQRQAIKSWLPLADKIIVFGNDHGVEQLCEEMNLIHIKDIRSYAGVPYVADMFDVSSEHANDGDYMVWTNSDIIYFDDFIKTIKSLNETKYMLVGSRWDWSNPSIVNDLTKEYFMKNIKNGIFKGKEHAKCGIDYVVHHRHAYLNKIDKNLVIAGCRHDMILVGIGVENKWFSCDITTTAFVVHENHERESTNLQKRIKNNEKCKGNQKYITSCEHKSVYKDNTICFI